MGKIVLENLEFYAYHGHFAEEKIIGTSFLVNAELDVNFDQATVTDQLADTVDYSLVYKCISDEMQISSALLEHVVNRIVDRILLVSSLINSVRVKISKINPPFGGKLDAVSVEMEKKNIL